MNRTALAEWEGGLRTGRGSVTIQDGSLCGLLFTYQDRFEGKSAMSPEGFIAAAHAASFAMSFAEQLELNRLAAERIDTVATVKVEMIGELQTITQVSLELVVHMRSPNPSQILAAAEQARASCSISRLIRAEITLAVKIRDRTQVSAA